MDESHHLATFSNTGSNCIDITAPGVDVSSTVRFSPTNGLVERYEGGWNGTSFSAPFRILIENPYRKYGCFSASENPYDNPFVSLYVPEYNIGSSLILCSGF